MYNPQIDTFLKVAELGSFSKAAEALYISPSAVLQQVKNLEANLGTKLFLRTQRGTTLTSAGTILYTEGPKLIEVSRGIRRQITELEDQEHLEICVGTSPIEQCRLFYTWWNLFTAEEKRYHVRIKPISSMGIQTEREDVDIIEGVYIGDVCSDEFDFLSLSTVPIVHAVWKEHPLAKRKILRYEDMRGQTMVTLSGNRLTEHIKRLRDDAEKHGIHVITTEYYDISTFSMCAMNGYILQMPLSSAYTHSEMVAIPCDWDYTLPYGLYYKKNATPLVKQFISYVALNKDKDNY
ncbi:MAG: LysR family transcriptional regulator [Oscillospiraceae bacterium]|nr:LysR family transcriptional regulator [Oscillospiraceae bacterium]